MTWTNLVKRKGDQGDENEKIGSTGNAICGYTITQSILLLGGQKIILDTALADLYGVETRVLTQAVKRNLNRFPEDFMFQLTAREFNNLRFQSGTSNLRSQFVISKKGGEERLLIGEAERLRSQFVILKKGRVKQVTAGVPGNLRSQIVISSQWGGTRSLPYAFTEQGVAMHSSVLRSDRAVRVNIEIMRAFVRLRQMLEGHKALAGKLARLEKKYDTQFKVVFDAIRQLMVPPAGQKKRPIGFASWNND